MIFLGRILQVDDRDEYYKTAIGVETGYTTDVYIIRISHNKIERRPAINDQVVFTGVEGQLTDFRLVLVLWNLFWPIKMTYFLFLQRIFKKLEICQFFPKSTYFRFIGTK